MNKCPWDTEDEAIQLWNKETEKMKFKPKEN